MQKLKERARKERKKINILLILKFLEENNFIESFEKLQQETTLFYKNFSISENIDLNLILKEFVEYFEYKFDKKPFFYR